MENKIETHFKFDESLMLHILGENNFPDVYSSFIELIKNAYDANLPIKSSHIGFCNIEINIENQEIIIEDNGIGMSEDDLINKWLVVGKSDKKDGDLSFQGDKGIGRIAIHKIARNVVLETKKRDTNSLVIWTSNWEHSEYAVKYDNTTKSGTKFVLSNLKHYWTDKDILKLKKVLKILVYNVENFNIYLNGEIISNDLEKEISDEKYEYLIEFKYDSANKKASIVVTENEFDTKILKTILPNYNDKKKYSVEFTLSQMITNYNRQHKKTDDYIYDESLDCGSFCGKILFRRGKTNELQIERFHYINKKNYETENGIMIYRDGFIVRPFGINRKNDFFDISGRARRSPATQTKDDGRWRVRLNNVTGIISISKKDNPKLIDQSNRNGFEENICLDYFKIIVDQSIDYFEKKRQDVTVAIDKHNKYETELNNNFEDWAKKTEKALKTHNHVLINKDDFKIIMNEKMIYEEDIENKNYDLRRMIYYTTQGLLTLSRYHEIKNNCDFIENFKDNILEGMIELGIKEELENKYSGCDDAVNLFSIVDKMQSINDNNAFYARKVLDEEKSNTFEEYIQFTDFMSVLTKIKETWKTKIYGIKISIKIDGLIADNLKIRLTKSDVFSIIDNLILNTTEINENVNNYEITITIGQENNKLRISYENTGADLADKFQDNPNEIFEYGKKDENKKRGNGIGMWILKKAVDLSKGECYVSKTKGGFGVDMLIGTI